MSDQSSLAIEKKSADAVKSAIAEAVTAKRKRPRDGEGDGSQGLVIGTHSGKFHCDEALAVFILRNAVPEFKGAAVKRTRNKAILDAECDVVVDVGGEHVPSRLRFDHHQRGFDEVLGDGFNTKLSSAGLVWRHFGRQFVRCQLRERGGGGGASEPDESTVELVFNRVYQGFVEHVDAVDNGVIPFPGVAGGDALYNYHCTSLSARVGALNAPWNHPEADDDDAADRRFEQASALTGKELLSSVSGIVDVWLPARQIVLDAYNARKSVHESGHIMSMTKFAPWQTHLNDIESEQADKTDSQVYYVVIGEEIKNDVRIQAVPDAPGSFTSRLALPQEWRGLRNEDLQKVSGVADAVFVHAAGFCGGAKTYQGCISLAKKALTLLKNIK